MSTSTPWGRSQQSKKWTRGIIEHSCAGHGGFHVSKTLNAQIHAAWRREDGWYEEDVAWCVIVITFPAVFAVRGMLGTAIDKAKNYYPREYEQVTGSAVKLYESVVLRQEADRAKHLTDWVAVAAYGDWKVGVPKGKVGIQAVRPGDRNHVSTKWFAVSEADYSDPAQQCSLGFIVDLARHQEIAAL